MKTTTENTANARMERDLDPTDENERGRPCCVYHPDAGGRCERTSTVRMYDLLCFCPEHGAEARLGALMEVYQDAAYFFDRFRNPHVPDINGLVDRELGAAVVRMNDESPSDQEYYRALSLAYPDTPQRVREIIRQWERDERGDGGVPPFDLLLDSLNTLRRLMRLSHEDGQDWLTEILEYQRQEMAAQAAFALELANREQPVA